MSMLAERRRKQKWALDPRNTRWSNDDSKFGQRMLEKMGWSKGKGLGAQEQGATEHIKVQVKNNHLGLGATINNEDNWIAHQDDFNQLLAELNTCHGPEIADSSDNKEKRSFSLEEKSKVSKNRVHYKKFTKGLLSTPTCCRTEDRPCWPFSPFEERLKDDSSPATPDGNENSTTTTSTFTIQEYFAKRMAELKNKSQVVAAGPDLPETQMERKKGKKRKKEAKNKNVENYTQPKTKKKRDEAEQQLRDPQGDENSDASAEDGEDCMWPFGDQDLPPKPKKKREKKKLQKQVEAAMDATVDETPVKKKKKKKKDSK
ncbi:PIN2/TERF1-interacting telomerase inhibitor 1 isoform X1 [Myotis lucifugus]|uniref:PIN2/TERF1-interacting telomerase inhibitor 1 isoform X1 n=1 Tax=Myotis lucifugus TaxID=59463 RepID=UPI0006D712A9|nr:PIN2/TERF1-interacting telomerase inhibitor 1 isoform X1 [Myotis lucifugus]